jgi:hypothetical protein
VDNGNLSTGIRLTLPLGYRVPEPRPGVGAAGGGGHPSSSARTGHVG